MTTELIHDETHDEKREVKPEVKHEDKQQPAAPAVKRGRRFLRALRTFVVVLILLAIAAGGGYYIVQKRLAAQAYVDIGNAVLTASPVNVSTPDAGIVTTLLVGPHARVAQGQELAYITVPGNDTRNTETKILRAPSMGTVAAVNVAVGNVTQPGQALFTMYDQRKLSFHAQVRTQELRQLRLGMTAYITGPGLDHKVKAKLQRVVPKMGGDPVKDDDRLTVVLIPEPTEVTTVSTLVPGLEFDATVDTKTGSGTTPAVNSA